jgi:sugar phosphate isomerase/epimerase
MDVSLPRCFWPRVLTGDRESLSGAAKQAGTVGERPLFDDLLLSIVDDDREKWMAYAAAHGYGVEIRDFGWHKPLSEAAARAELVLRYRDRLRGFRGPVTVHGPDSDLSPGGDDPAIVAISRQRISACLDVVEELGVKRMISHTCFHHPEPQPSYLTRWIARHAAFWREVLEGRKVEVVLENLWDPDPQAFAAAVDEADLPNVGACLDVGHAHVHSDFPPHRWVEALGPRIRHLHLHDNDRSYDRHDAIGEGTLDWSALVSALRQQGLRPTATLEVRFDRIAASVERLRTMAR